MTAPPDPPASPAPVDPVGADAPPVPAGSGALPVPAGSGAPPASAGSGAPPASAGSGAPPAPAGSGALPASAGSGAPPAPAGDYAAARIAGDLLFTAGMTPKGPRGLPRTGRLGDQIDTARGVELAAVATRRAVAAAREVASRYGRTLADPVAMTVYIAATPEFTEHTAVADGASAALGGMARPARAAVGVTSLPGGAPVEVQLIMALLPPP